MSRGFFIDSSVIIDLQKKIINGETKQLKELISSDDELAINGFILLEVLRTIPSKKEEFFIKWKRLLKNRFEILELNLKVFEEAIVFNRFCNKKAYSIRGNGIDLINFCSAKYYDFNIIHKDKDFNKLEEYYQIFKEEFK